MTAIDYAFEHELMLNAIDRAIDREWISGRVFRAAYAKHEVNYKVIIFDHGFAKAFWGEEPTDIGIGAVMPAWKYHLQQMVLLQRPIEYLQRFTLG